MDRRDFLKAAGVSAMSVGLGGCFEGSRRISDKWGKRPNLVFVFPDQMRGQAMGFLNEEPVITPNLDKFAKESLVLPQTVSNYPVCSPFRAMLMTGKYPHATNVLNNCYSETTPYDCQLKTDERCWSDILKDKGYSLGYIGKWHLDSPYKPYIDCKNNKGKFAWNEWCPPDRRHGFDFWYAYGTYDFHNRPLYWDNDAGRHGFRYVDQWGPEHEADLAIKYIKNEGGKYRDADKPFALVVSMNPPHTPYELVPKRYVDTYKDMTMEQLCKRPNIPAKGTKWGNYYRRHIRNYYGMITGVDEQFGRIVNALQQQGIEEDTIVVFTSDHGNCLGIHNKPTKSNRYEESMRIPFMIRWPGKIKPRQDDLLFSSLDMCPTLLELMGCGDEIREDVDGVSYAGQFSGENGERPKWQWYMWADVKSPELGRRGIRNEKYTFVVSKFKDKPKKYILHDNRKDPFQLKNIASQRGDLVEKLSKELDKILRKYNDPWRTA